MFLNSLLLNFFFIFAFLNIHSPAKAHQKPEGLPICLSEATPLLKIKKQLDSSKNRHRYDGYRDVLRTVSDNELFARLAYSETLAANCTNLNDEISLRIVNVIGNRMLVRKGDVRSVIFQNAQFASSLHVYKNSRFMDFLCPKDLTLWTKIFNDVEIFMKKRSGALSADTLNYFLYQHDPRWPKEPWTLKENMTGASEKVRQCLRTFYVPDWK